MTTFSCFSCLLLLLVWTVDPSYGFYHEVQRKRMLLLRQDLNYNDASSSRMSTPLVAAVATQNDNNDTSLEHSETTGNCRRTSTRRSLINAVPLLFSAAALTVSPPLAAHADIPSERKASSSPTTTKTTSPAITNKVQFNIRVSRPDGSFYVRDDDANEPDLDRVFYCRLVVGLFGQDVPNHVQRFLSYCIGTEQQMIMTSSDGSSSDAPPVLSYASSMMTGLDPATGLLRAGVVPSLRVTLAVAGTTPALEYRGRLLPASLWMDAKTNDSRQQLSHIGKGLLTHARLDATPSFGITTRGDTRELDASHQVFGRILFEESEGAYEFLDRVRDLPTYSLERPIEVGNDGETAPVDAVVDAVFAAQRSFFRNVAKNVGDSRLDKVYPGKFLRRIEVTQVSVVK